jgi:hypothetical protein
MHLAITVASILTFGSPSGSQGIEKNSTSNFTNISTMMSVEMVGFEHYLLDQKLWSFLGKPWSSSIQKEQFLLCAFLNAHIDQVMAI